ncbi:MAG: mevalonate kinase family protein [Thermoproteota archaeon]
MDWCGFSVIPVAIDMRSYVQVGEGDKGTVEIHSYAPFDLYELFDPAAQNLNMKSDLRYAQATLVALERNGVRTDGIRIRFLRAEQVERIRGSSTGKLLDLPVKKGLSSSAAICVAVAAAVDIFSSKKKVLSDSPISGEEMAKYANIAYVAEREILGVNCGQMDQYASAFGKLLYVDCSTAPAKVQKLKPSITLPIVIGDTRQRKDTPKILAWLGKRFEAREERFMEGMRNIVRIVEEARRELERKDSSRERIGRLMNENQRYLDEYLQVSGSCPVSPSNLDLLIRAALDAGALGAKLSGSGGGGAMLALTEPGDEDQIAEAIRRAGGDAYISRVAERGVTVEYSNY